MRRFLNPRRTRRDTKERQGTVGTAFEQGVPLRAPSCSSWIPGLLSVFICGFKLPVLRLVLFLVDRQKVGGDLEGEDAHGGGVGEAGGVDPASVRVLGGDQEFGGARVPELP